MMRIDIIVAARVAAETQSMRMELESTRARLERLAIDAYFGSLLSSDGASPSRVVQLRVPGSGVELEICGPAQDRSIIGTIDACGGNYEPHVVSYLAKRLPENATCVDIGANLGAMSLQISSIATRGHIYAFEPARATFDYLVRNIRANDIANVTPVNFGLSNGTADAVLNYIEDLSGCSFVSVDGVEVAEGKRAVQETIQLTSLDKWKKDNRIGRIDFIKLDAEGMEQLVLDGARATIKRDAPDLAIGFNPHTSDDFGHGSSEGLYRLLADRWETILIIPRDMGDPIPVQSYGQLLEYTRNGPGWEDLYCTDARREH